MKKSIFKSLLILFTILMVTGCEENLILFDGSKKVVGFSSTSVVIKENAGTGDIMVYLGSEAGATANVDFEISNDGFDSPAVEGVDFTIASTNIQLTTGEVAIVVNVIDNDVFGGDLKFRLTLLPGTGYELTKAKSVVVTISDDEHPLKNWIGTYDVDAPSFTVPGSWDEAWVVTTSPVEGHPDQLSLEGVGLSGTSLIATLDTDAMTITIAPGQDIGLAYAAWGYDVEGVDEITVYYGYEDLSWDPELEIVGTLEANGDMTIDGWCHIQNGAVWDVFNTTWTKRAK